MNDEKIIIQTNHPYKELLNVASRTSIEAEKLDFSLLYFSTFYANEDENWQKLSEKELILFDDEAHFLNPNLKIKQEYKIEIFPKTENVLENKIKLIANKNLTKIIANIDAKNLEYHEKLPMQMLQEIYKKMLKNNFFIGIRIFDFKKQLLLINEKIHRKEGEEFQLVVCKGVEMLKAQNESLELSFKKKIENLNLGQNTSIIAVDEGEIVLRHLKPKKGQEGRNLRFEFLPVSKEEENKKIHFSCSNKFEIKQEEFEELYIAKQKGYVLQENDKFDIVNIADFNGVDLKNVGCIKVGTNSGITINVKSTAEFDDAIKSGVSIECEELNIEGNVAQNTNLSANKLSLRGTTHTQTKIFAKNAKITTHRGYLEGENVEVELLENGHIKAKNIKIQKSLGGTLEAENIFIANLMSNNTIIFNKNIVLETCEGTNNKFLAQISHESDFEAELAQNQTKIKELNLKLEPIKTSMQNSKEAIETLLNEIDNLKKNQQEIPQSYLAKIKEYQEYLEFYESLTQKEKDLNLEKSELLEKIKQAQNELLKAKIINKKGIWSDMNEIKFKFTYPKQELTHLSSTHEKIKLFSLKKIIENNEEIIKINPLEEYNEKDIEWLSQSKES